VTFHEPSSRNRARTLGRVPYLGRRLRRLSLHPFVIDDGDQGIGYMADTFVVEAGGGVPISGLSRDPYEVS
jgi:hypothetical protein